jgi:hypothetical protein
MMELPRLDVGIIYTRRAGIQWIIADFIPDPWLQRDGCPCKQAVCPHDKKFTPVTLLYAPGTMHNLSPRVVRAWGLTACDPCQTPTELRASGHYGVQVKKGGIKWFKIS